MKELVGETITQLLISKDKMQPMFVTNTDKRLGYVTNGNTCNHQYVWFYHIAGLDALLGSKVVRVEEKPWHDVELEDCCYDEIEEAIVWTIYTPKGYFDVEVRNSHNGYYGGYVFFHEDAKWDDMVPVTKDF